MAFFVRNTNKGIVVASKKMETRTLTVNGVTRQIRKQAGDVRFGFFACENPVELGLKAGDEVPVTITDSQIADAQTGELIPNLYWAD